MNNINRQRVGFTKLGFSKATFSCCAHFNHCNYGKESCYWDKIDAEVKEYCNCYQKHRTSHRANFENLKKVDKPIVSIVEVENASLAISNVNTNNLKKGQRYWLCNDGQEASLVYSLGGKL